MPPIRRTRSSTIVRVRWQHRTAAVPMGTVQAVIQQASDHFRLNGIIDKLVLVGVIDGEELELTSNTLKLLAKDAVVVLRCTARADSPVGAAPKSDVAPPESLPARRLDRPPELPARPPKARSPSPMAGKGSCACTVCVRAAGHHKSAPESGALPSPSRHCVGGVNLNVKSDPFDDSAITLSIFVPCRPPCTFTTRPSVTGRAIAAKVAQKLNMGERDFVLYSVHGQLISPNTTLYENGIRGGGALELRFSPSRGGYNHLVLPRRVSTIVLDGKYRSSLSLG